MTRSLPQVLLSRVRRVSPAILARIAWNALWLVPSFVGAFLASRAKAVHWKRPDVCRDFVRRHRQRFGDLDPSTLELETRSGGVSNCNAVWRLRARSGATREFFVKVFLPVGSFWARHLSRFSPFPRVAAGGERDRFEADRRGRLRLARRRVPVPRLVAADDAEGVLVTDYLRGENVDEVLRRAASAGFLTFAAVEVVRLCGKGLRDVHRAGWSLIDTQPVNCIWVASERKVYFTDLEYCTREDNRAWDLAFFLSFLTLRFEGPARRAIERAFIEGYGPERPDPAAVERTLASLREYGPILETILDVRSFRPEELLGVR